MMLVIQFNKDNRVKAIQKSFGRTLWTWQKMTYVTDSSGAQVLAWLDIPDFDNLSTNELEQYLKEQGIKQQDVGLQLL
jgi:hypothetical protein